tara:strand:- start:524 stop:790 length:267 start_codon:yes stop_codon:yes gene_type:complete
MTYSIKIDDIEIDIEYLYDDGEQRVWIESNGNPETPGYPPNVEIMAVFALLKDKNNNDVMVDILPISDQFLNKYDLEIIEERILKSYE